MLLLDLISCDNLYPDFPSKSVQKNKDRNLELSRQIWYSIRKEAQPRYVGIAEREYINVLWEIQVKIRKSRQFTDRYLRPVILTVVGRIRIIVADQFQSIMPVLSHANVKARCFFAFGPRVIACALHDGSGEP